MNTKYKLSLSTLSILHMLTTTLPGALNGWFDLPMGTTTITTQTSPALLGSGAPWRFDIASENPFDNASLHHPSPNATLIAIMAPPYSTVKLWIPGQPNRAYTTSIAGSIELQSPNARVNLYDSTGLIQSYSGRNWQPIYAPATTIAPSLVGLQFELITGTETELLTIDINPQTIPYIPPTLYTNQAAFLAALNTTAPSCNPFVDLPNYTLAPNPLTYQLGTSPTYHLTSGNNQTPTQPIVAWNQAIQVNYNTESILIDIPNGATAVGATCYTLDIQNNPQPAAVYINLNNGEPIQVASTNNFIGLIANGSPITRFSVNYTNNWQSLPSQRYITLDNLYIVGTNELTIARALNTTNLTWTTTGNAGWFGQTNDQKTLDGHSARSGILAPNQHSRLTTTVTGPATLYFYENISPNSANSLQCSLDHTIQYTYYGYNANPFGWRPQSLNIPPGVHTLQWDYTTDENDSYPSTGAWLDYMNLVPTIPPTLKIRLTNNTTTLSWPAPSTGFVLQQTTSLNTQWTNTTLPITTTSSTRSVTLPTPQNNRFFRLYKP